MVEMCTEDFMMTLISIKHTTFVAIVYAVVSRHQWIICLNVNCSLEGTRCIVDGVHQECII